MRGWFPKSFHTTFSAGSKPAIGIPNTRGRICYVLQFAKSEPVQKNLHANWHGSFLNEEELPTKLNEEDIDRVIWSYEDSCHGWDGEVAAIVKMKDGRYITWETFWGPTGDGFYEDAYGGNADIHISNNLKDAIVFGLSEAKRPTIDTVT